MKQFKLYATTIAIKMIIDDKVHYSIDTYPRIVRPEETDVLYYTFEQDFMKAYEGNGIESVRHIETLDFGYIDFDMISDGYINVVMNRHFDKFNYSILDF